MSQESEIEFETRGPLAVVTLNRPEALNALTLGMIRALQPKLEAWAADDAVKAVAIKGAGEKSFCAGGDVRAVWQAGKEGSALTREFFYEEYKLNRTIHVFPKPYVALIDGIVMGGGIGLSVHGSHRVAGDRTLAAMPETAIGLFPDVGGSWFLPRLPGRLGLWMALTGARLKAVDALYAGLATDYVPAADYGELEAALAQALTEGGDAAAAVDAAIARFATDPGPALLAEQKAEIDRLFAADGIAEILLALKADGGDWATSQLEILESRSPTSMKVTAEQLVRGRNLDFDACMTMEYRMSQAAMAGHDFYEGIRAVLVDKDHAPKWQPAKLAEVTSEMLEAYFAQPDSGDLTF
ncbi:enoyl-CoA hydratase/isomerase family protein [Algihabitans albus]|uniref:enoyl-CoA hydratase/isomerase family protein n=1 Tax=Algihabitans albus TaxID=2164067 RepID=UPI000E5C8095|nr:enoyl-CoA hydratase/isomerase family protein [Algihabitans albus]